MKVTRIQITLTHVDDNGKEHDHLIDMKQTDKVDIEYRFDHRRDVSYDRNDRDEVIEVHTGPTVSTFSATMTEKDSKPLAGTSDTAASVCAP